MNKVVFGEKQLQTIAMPFKHCLEVNEGTPRSSKTTAGVFRFARHLIESRDQNHLVVAYNQEQAYKLVFECDGLGLLHIFDGVAAIKHDDNGDHLAVYTPTGIKRVYYKGGGKADSCKSITGLSLGSVYFCEINLLHMTMIQECFRRTFAARDRWHLADLNPPAPNDPVISDVFNVQDTFWQHWTIDDNPIITPERKREIYETCIKNPYLYKRDWLGERAIPEGVIYSMFDDKRHVVTMIPQDERPIEYYYTADGGLSDATSVSCYVVTMDKDGIYKLYRLANWYYSGHDTGITLALSVQARKIAREFIPYCKGLIQQISPALRRESFTKVDPACKALRAELELLGIQTEKADNNGRDIKGSSKGIKVGIEYLQSCIADNRFYLVDNERYGHADFLREIGMYCVDAHGNPVDAYNHAMDETRYANNYFYKTYVV